MTNSLPMMSLTGSSGGFGAAVAGDAGVAGLGGLFSALMGGAPAAGGEGMVSVLMPKPVAAAGAAQTTVVQGDVPAFDLSAFLAAQGQVQQVVQLEDEAPALTVSGDAETVQAFLAQVQDIYQKVVVEGGLSLDKLSDADQLAGALVELGMTEEEATAVAERIQTMLALIQQNQDDMNDEAAGSLVAMMLAVMAQAGEQPAAAEGDSDVQAMSIQILSVEQSVTTGNAAVSAWRGATGDVARDMLGLSGADAKTAEPATQQAFEVVVTRDGESARIGMVMPDVDAMDKPVTVKADAPVKATTEAVNVLAETRGAATQVNVNDVGAEPKGETYYKLQADKNGVETVTAVKPLPESKDVLPDGVRDLSQMAARTDVAATAAAAAPTGAAFAERVAQVQAMLDHSHVTKQVAVQIQPLLEQGGGTVRLQLNPHELGKITVELQVVDGKVHGAIEASDPVVMEQLARELHTLRHGLADAGLKVGEQGIDLMLSNQGHQGQGGHQGQQHAHDGASGATANGRGGVDAAGDLLAGAEAPLADKLAAWVFPDRLLDVNV